MHAPLKLPKVALVENHRDFKFPRFLLPIPTLITRASIMGRRPGRAAAKNAAAALS